MKTSRIIKLLLGAGLAFAICFEIGLFQRAFDSKSIVEDGVVGADFWIVEVDGKATDRIQHGLMVTKVPFALVEPGARVMELSVTPHPAREGASIKFHATIKKGVNYRITRNADGHPELISK